jgi:imidazolonepropionase-like amidohydrolase
MNTSIRGLITSHLTMIRHAHEIGVPLAVGTDCVLPGIRYKEASAAELKYFEQTGLSRAEVLQIACEGGAKLLEM